MKKFLLAVFAVFFLSSCNNFIDDAVDLLNEATEKAMAAKNIAELELIEEKLETKFEIWEEKNAEELEALEERADNGDVEAEEMFDQLIDAMDKYDDTHKARKRKLRNR